MTITDATTQRRTHRPKQPENALPDPATKPRYCCAHSKGEPADAPHRVIVVDEVRYDAVRGDQRIYYTNEANGRRGSSLYASFKSGAEFWPAPAPVAAPVVEPTPTVARRPLPAPWRWWGRGIFEFLARLDNEDYSAADAYPDEAVVYTSERRNAETARRFEATSQAEARERAEDECWRRGLLTESNAPPMPPAAAPAPASHPASQLPLTLAVHPVDGARALALLERLTVAAETIGRFLTVDCAERPIVVKPANDRAA